MRLLLLILPVTVVTSEAETCSERPEDAINSVHPCVKLVNGETVLVSSVDDCNKQTFCCSWEGKCWSKTGMNVALPEAASNPVDAEAKLREKYEEIKAKTSSGSSQRLLGLNSGSRFATKLEFPKACSIQPNTPYVLHPPVDIPYCFRIPCDPEDPQLDSDLVSCASKPGCYFDTELFEMRKFMGDQVMPGAPVCHLAIRNAVFQSQAHAYMIKYKSSWTPYFTHCLLQSFEEMIMRQQKECPGVIGVLEHFGVKAKIAGWKTISSKACLLIDGCWRADKGCFYPVDMSNIAIKSGQTNPAMRGGGGASYVMPYGRPKCQDFDNSGPREALKSINDCLMAGCSLDRAIEGSYYKYMYQIGKSLNATDHWVFWINVLQGRISPENIDEYKTMDLSEGLPAEFLIKLISSGGNSWLSNTRPLIPSMLGQSSGTFPPPSIFGQGSGGFTRPSIFGQYSGGASPVSIFGQGSDSTDVFPINPSLFGRVGGLQPTIPMRNMGALSSMLLGSQTMCGPTFMPYGGRPCEPSKPTTYNPTFCPYVKFPTSAVPWMKPLKGSVEGCCEANLCYTRKSAMATARSGASYYHTPWSLWSECSQSCGKGKRRRNRRCVSKQLSVCSDPLEDESVCEGKPCEGWSEWGEWSQCSKTCAKGVQTSSRTCHPMGEYCVGEKKRTRECDAGTTCNEKFREWSPWVGSCEPCGSVMYRTRKCALDPCEKKDLEQMKECSFRCGNWAEWEQWTFCKIDYLTFACARKRSRKCVAGGQKENAKCESGAAVETKTCQCPYSG